MIYKKMCRNGSLCFADKLGDGEWGKHHSAYHDTPGNEKTSSHPAIDDYNKKNDVEIPCTSLRQLI